MGTGEAPDDPADGHEGPVDPDELEIAILLIQDAMNADLDFAIGMAAMMQAQGGNNVAEWAKADPHRAIRVAEAADDLPEQFRQLDRVVHEHGRAQRDLAREEGYERDVWAD